MTAAYRYSAAAVAKAYGRSAVGLAATLVPLAVLEPAAPLALALVPAAGLFLVYLARSIALATRTIVVDPSGIRGEGLFGARIPWDALETLELSYYSTRRDGSDGWSELVVRGPRRALRIDSRLAGFGAIVERAAREAVRRGRSLDERTATHLAALGIALEAPCAREPAPGARHA